MAVTGLIRPTIAQTLRLPGPFIPAGGAETGEMAGASFYAPFYGEVVDIYVKINGTGPTGGSAIFNFNRNGGGFSLTGAERPTITTGNTEGSSIKLSDILIQTQELIQFFYESGPNNISNVDITVHMREMQDKFAPVVVVTADYFPNIHTDQVILADCTSADIFVTLPSLDQLVSRPGWNDDRSQGALFVVQHIGTANKVFVEASNSFDVQGILSQQLSRQGDTLVIRANQDEYKIIVDNRDHARNARPILSTSGNLTLDVLLHHTVLFDCSGGNRTATLPPIATAYNSGTGKGHIFILQKVDSSANTLTADADGAETIQGATTAVAGSQWECLIIQAFSDGWHILARIATTEAIQDIVGAMVVDSNTINATYNDAGGTESLEVEVTTSIPFTEQGSDPSTPASGIVSLYAKNDNSIYIKDDGGIVTNLAPLLKSYLAADGTNATATMANTGLSVTVKAGKKYAFKCILLVSDSVAGDGVQVDFAGGSAGETDFRAQVTGFDSALTISAHVNDLTDVVAAAAMGEGMVEISGSFEPSGAGTFIPRYAQNIHTTGTLTIYRGSHLLMWEIV